MKPPLQALEGPGEEASVNAKKVPPQALEGPGEEPSWCILYSTEHRTGTLPGPGEVASCESGSGLTAKALGHSHATCM